MRSRTFRSFLGLAIFSASVGFAVASLPEAPHSEGLSPLLLIPLAVGPVIVLLNSVEYGIMARAAGRPVPLSSAVRLSVVASLANFLPVPGAVLVRLGALKRLGSSSGRALRSTVMVTMSWVATALVLAGILLSQIRPGPWQWVLASAAVLPMLGGLTAGTFQAGLASAIATQAQLFCLNWATIAFKASSYYFILVALGSPVPPAASIGLTVAPIAAQATGFLPAGLGLQEVLAGLIGASAGIEASAAILASAADRVLTLLALGVLHGAIVAMGGSKKGENNMAAAGSAAPGPAAAPRAGKPRVLALATTFPAAGGDGTPEFVLSLARALKSDFELTVLTPRRPDAPRRQSIDGVNIERFAYFFRRWENVTHGAILRNLQTDPVRWVQVPFLLGAMFLAAIRHCLRQRPAVIHAHWVVPAGFVALVLKKVLGIPYVVTAHGTDVYGLRAAPFRLLKKMVVNAAHTTAPGSRDLARILGMTDEQADRFVVPMGVDVNGIAREVGTRDPEPHRFLFVGRLVESKGVDTFIRALSRVSGATAVIAGDGKDRQDLERLSQDLGLDGRVSFLGQAPRRRVLDELRLARALVVPSTRSEGTAQVMSEAMAAGVPVIGSRLGGIKEQINSGENGYLVDPGSVESLASALELAMSQDDVIEGWAQAARAKIEGSALDLTKTKEKYRGFLSAAAGAADPAEGPPL